MARLSSAPKPRELGVCEALEGAVVAGNRRHRVSRRVPDGAIVGEGDRTVLDELGEKRRPLDLVRDGTLTEHLDHRPANRRRPCSWAGTGSMHAHCPEAGP